MLGLTGSSLAGGFVVASSLVPPSGTPGILSSDLGTAAAAIVTKAGTTQGDAATNATADLFLVGTNILNAAPTRYFSVRKGVTTLWGASSILKWDNGGSNTWQMDGNPSTAVLRMGLDGLFYLTLRSSDGYSVMRGIEVRLDGNATAVLIKSNSAGRIDQSGTDSTGTAGAATIDKPCGKSAIAAGAATVTITCNQVTAASILLITPHARDATGLLPIAVPGAGAFTVTTTANCTAALPFSWEVKTIL